MPLTRSWEFPGRPGSWPSRFLDHQRQRLNRRLVRYLVTMALPGNGSHVVEAGSGSAYGSSLLAAHAQVRLSVALDIDPEALREARRHHPTLPMVLGDLHHLPIRSASLDLIWNSSTLEHVRSPDAALREMKRVVRDDGYVFLGVPYRFGPLAFQPWIKNTRLGLWIGSLFDRHRLADMITDQGLKPVSTFSYFFRCFIAVLAQKPAASVLPSSACRLLRA